MFAIESASVSVPAPAFSMAAPSPSAWFRPLTIVRSPSASTTRLELTVSGAEMSSAPGVSR